MSDTFLTDLGDIDKFHKLGEALFDLPRILTSSPYGPQTGTVSESRERFSPEFPFLFRKTIPIMLCSAWESFVDHIKAKDNARYVQHFTTQDKYPWYNDPINDIAQIRHCMAHQNGIMDQAHLDKIKITLNKSKYPLGPIKLEALDIDDYLKAFKSAYDTIMA